MSPRMTSPLCRHCGEDREEKFSISHSRVCCYRCKRRREAERQNWRGRLLALPQCSRCDFKDRDLVDGVCSFCAAEARGERIAGILGLAVAV
jgi:hypothetical protein